jgi:hypothetical protein
MPNPHSVTWPLSQAPATGQAASMPATLPDLGPALQAQARLWNQLLGANRLFWALYTPWLQAAPLWWGGAAGAPSEGSEAGLEPAQTADGVPDAFESQARSWNRLLDAQRQFWAAVAWPVHGAAEVGGEVPSVAAPVAPTARKAASRAGRSR